MDRQNGLIARLFGGGKPEPLEPLLFTRSRYSGADFEELDWRALSVRAINVPCCTSYASRLERLPSLRELVLDVKAYVQVLPNADNLWAPGTLEFHGITDLNVQITATNSGFQNGPSDMMITGIMRDLVLEQKVHLDRPYYSWALEMGDFSQCGRLTFGAYGFTLILGKAVRWRMPRELRELMRRNEAASSQSA